MPLLTRGAVLISMLFNVFVFFSIFFGDEWRDKYQIPSNTGMELFVLVCLLDFDSTKMVDHL